MEAIPLENERDEDLDDGMTDPEEIIEANPQWGGAATLASAASFDAVVPGAMAAAYANMFWNVERYGEFSLSNGGGTLETTFEQMFGMVDEDGKKKDEDDGWDDYADAQERRADAKREIDRTLSERELDDLPWQGDMNESWDIDGTSVSRLTLYNAAKAVRKKLPTLARENNWTEAERADQEHWLSEYERLIKAGDRDGAEQVSQQHFKPQTRDAVNQEVSNANRDNRIAPDLARHASGADTNAEVSTNARADIIAAASAAPPGRQPTVPPQSERPSATALGLSHPPDFELTPTFTAAADPEPAQPAVAPSPTELANASAVRSTPQALDQTFSI